MSAEKLLEALGDQVGIVYVDSQPKLRLIAYGIKPPHDDSQAKPNVGKASNDSSYDDSQRKYIPPKAGDTVVIRGRSMVIPELDSDGQPMPNYGF